LGPFTETALPLLISTETPPGTGIGLIPIIDIVIPHWFQVV
jgi:hypothetical protein